MKALDSKRDALCICAIVALLSGCGGLQPPIGAPGAVTQREEIAAADSAAMARAGGHHTLPASSYEVLHRFHGRDGSHPTAGLINVNAMLYGTASAPGGVVYSISTTGKERVLHRFHGLDGKNPYANLIDVNGTLYGTTYGGGDNDEGTAFSVTTTGAEKVLYSFGGGSDGKNPAGSLITVDGTLYGTTDWGGSGSCTGGCGTIFSITASGTEQVLHTFGGGSDGSHPDAGLTNVKGTLYGTTESGGANAEGTVFSVTTSGKEQVLYSFAGHDGAAPQAGLINVNGTLFGTTYSGGSRCGSYGCGTVFSVSTRGTEKVLYSFGGGSDGAAPEAGLVNVNGTLYGTTTFGGGKNDGTVFSVAMTGKERVLHSFGGGSDGSLPMASLIDVRGKLYGTSWRGGGSGCRGVGCGTVFAFTP